MIFLKGDSKYLNEIKEKICRTTIKAKNTMKLLNISMSRK